MRFYSKSTSLILQVTPGKTTIIDGKVIKEPGIAITFDKGMFDTTDETLIAKIKETPAFKNGDVVAVTDEEVKATKKSGKKEQLVDGGSE